MFVREANHPSMIHEVHKESSTTDFLAGIGRVETHEYIEYLFSLVSNLKDRAFGKLDYL